MKKIITIALCPECGASNSGAVFDAEFEDFIAWGCAECGYLGPSAHANDFDQAITLWNRKAGLNATKWVDRFREGEGII